MENNKKAAVLIIALAVIVLQIVVTDVSGYGLSVTSPLWTRLIYSFFHGSWFHLLLNVYVLLTLGFKLDLRMREIFISYILACAAPSFCIGTLPTVGLSGMIYAIFGMRTMRNSNPGSMILNIVLITAVSMFLSHIAWRLHAYCYSCGLLISLLTTPLQWRKK